LRRGYYQHDMERLDDMLRSLGRLTVEAIRQSLLALRRRDAIGARRLIGADADIDALQRDVESQVYGIIALQQPVGRDLRLLLASMAVAQELERAGDYAKQIARAVETLAATDELPGLPGELARLGALASRMIEDAIAAFIARDPAAARALATADDEADRLEQAVRETVRAMVAEDIRLLESGLLLTGIASTLERLADRATNIAERVVYLATGETEPLNS
jgi:phosphate transport system protein